MQQRWNRCALVSETVFCILIKSSIWEKQELDSVEKCLGFFYEKPLFWVNKNIIRRSTRKHLKRTTTRTRYPKPIYNQEKLHYKRKNLNITNMSVTEKTLFPGRTKLKHC